MMVSLRSKSDNLEKLLKAKKQELQRAKLQMVTLLQTSGRRLDRDRIEDLERQNEHQQREIKRLTTQLQAAKKQVRFILKRFCAKAQVSCCCRSGQLARK